MSELERVTVQRNKRKQSSVYIATKTNNDVGSIPALFASTGGRGNLETVGSLVQSDRCYFHENKTKVRKQKQAEKHNHHKSKQETNGERRLQKRRCAARYTIDDSVLRPNPLRSPLLPSSSSKLPSSLRHCFLRFRGEEHRKTTAAAFDSAREDAYPFGCRETLWRRSPETSSPSGCRCHYRRCSCPVSEDNHAILVAEMAIRWPRHHPCTDKLPSSCVFFPQSYIRSGYSFRLQCS